jgi:hypothetical protein
MQKWRAGREKSGSKKADGAPKMEGVLKLKKKLWDRIFIKNLSRNGGLQPVWGGFLPASRTFSVSMV